MIANAQLLRAFARAGHRVRALAPSVTPGCAGRDGLAEATPAIEVARYEFPEFTTARDAILVEWSRDLHGRRLRERLPLLIDQERPDVLLLGGEAFAWHCPEIARRHALPCVLIMHGGPALHRMLDGTYPSAETATLLARYRRIDLLIAVARHFAAGLRTLGLQRIQVIPNPVDLDRFAPAPKDAALRRALAIGDADTVVLLLASLKDVKRPLDLVASAAQCLARNPRMVYLVVGDGPLRLPMEEACLARGIIDGFRFTGWIDHARVPAYVNLADIVVAPSEIEVQSLVYLETLACGRLLLASDIPAAREVLVDGETGLLFPRGDVHALAEKTLQAAGAPGLRARIGEQARQAAQAHALPMIAGTYLSTIERVLRARTVG